MQITDNFRDFLQTNECLLMDGSVTTLLYERGIYINRSFDEVNISNPDLVRDIHTEFIQAGAQIIHTNTWGANSYKLLSFGLENKLIDINRAGVRLARQAANFNAFVAGTIGPLGVKIEPWGPTPLLKAREIFREQAQILYSEGVSLFVLESFADLNEIQQAIIAILEICDLPILAMLTTNDEGQSLYGSEPEWFIRKLDEFGASIIGVNGGNGPAPLLEIIPRLVKSTSKPIVVAPNAGLPRLVDGRLIYMASPEYLGEFARVALLHGVRIIGGCSGMGPKHIRMMNGALRQSHAFAFTENSIEPETEVKIFDIKVPEAERSQWSRKILAKKFVLSVELVPPKGYDINKLVEKASYCKANGIDAINIPDGPRASARMSAFATSCAIERDVGIETILHYACRDRNLLGIQSDFLGAAALGIKNILCITGDPPKMGNYPNATAVFDTDSIGLINMIARLNSGLDLGGSFIGKSTVFSPGVGVNPLAPDMKKEKFRFRHKIMGGAEWAITQSIYDADSLLRFIEFASKYNIPIIAGIWPLLSLKGAIFMANEVPGVYVPKWIMERFEACTSTEDQKKVGMDMARELIAKIRNSVQGLQLSAPLGQVELAINLIQ